MGFKDLKILGEKEKRIYLFLGILLMLASIFSQFEGTIWRGSELFMWVIYTCVVYFCFNFILRDRISKYNYFIFPLSFLLSYPLTFFLAFGKIGDISIGTIVDSILVLFAIYYWFIITALFTVNKLFKNSTELDLKIEKLPKSINYTVRAIIFFGGALISTLLLLISSDFIFNYGIHSSLLRFILWPLTFFMILYIWFFFIIGCVALGFKKEYFWFGPVFVLCSFYAIYIMLQAADLEYSFDPTSSIPALEWTLFFASLFLLLSTTADLVGEQSETIVKRVKIIKPESMIIGLIFSMGMVEYSSSITPLELTGLQLSFMSDFFPIFIGIFGVYAIYSFNKKMKLQKEQVELVEISIPEKPKITVEQKEISKERIKPILCPQCGKSNTPDSEHCVYCGYRLVAKEIEPFKEEVEIIASQKIELKPITCPQCGKSNTPDSEHCVYCSYSLVAKEIEPFEEEKVIFNKVEEGESSKGEVEIITTESKELKPIFCPRCGKSNTRDSKFCVYCSYSFFVKETEPFKEGTEFIASQKIEPKSKTCPQCGKSNTPDSEHCVYCGFKLSTRY
ncbi:MAG: zinc ribbon domain-containing protein [Promethearchaeota archaeon]